MPKAPWCVEVWAASPGLDLEGHTPHLTASIVGAAPGSRLGAQGDPPAFPGRPPRHTLTSREPVTDVL